MKLQKQNGNMYDWVTHMLAHIGGECPHKCVYCYENRDDGKGGRFRDPKLCGPLTLDEDSFGVNFGQGKTIFIDHRNDLWCKDVPSAWISRVLSHCETFPNNRYLFQTKNPDRYLEFADRLAQLSCMVGTTIETNRIMPTEFSTAPWPPVRAEAMTRLRERYPDMTLFVTVEPIVNFDVQDLLNMFEMIRPNFCNVGADSKRHSLPEPSKEDVEALLFGITALGIEIREKHNLTRLLGYDATAPDAPWRKL